MAKEIDVQSERNLEKQHTPTGLISTPRTIFRFIGIVILVILGGVIIGLATSVLSNFIYIVFLFPLAMGYAGGKIVADAVRLARIRKIYPVIVLSLLVAVAIYGTLHYGRYVGLQVAMSMEMFDGLDPALDDENFALARAVLDYALKQETGHSGFVGYLLLKANDGISIGRFYSSNRVNLGPILTWLYWLLEFGIILGITFSMGKNRINVPACESCGSEYGGEKHLGGTAAANESIVLDLIRQKDFVSLGKVLESNAELPSVEIYLLGCETCNQGQARLIVRRASQGVKGMLQFTDTSQTTLPPGESARLLGQLSSVEN